jgi:CBS domain containing-hemolysin-like protein
LFIGLIDQHRASLTSTSLYSSQKRAALINPFMSQDMIENVLEIKDTYVREVMTPLVDVVAIDSAVPLMEFRNLWVKHQYSR